MKLIDGIGHSVVFICDVLGLKNDGAPTEITKIEGFSVTNDKSFYNDFTQRDVEQLGKIRLSRYYLNTVFTRIMDIAQAYEDYEVDSPIRLSQIIGGRIQGIIMFLWFIKDNAVNSGCLFTEYHTAPVGSDSNEIFLDERLAVFSTAEGRYDLTSFTGEEITKAYELYKGTMELTKNYQVRMDQLAAEINPIATPNPIHLLDYNKFTRIELAIQFLVLARTQSILPFKITFYMAIYECLFSSDNSEIAHKVAERVVYYVGGNRETLLFNFKLIKDAYTLRSDYIHGGSLTKSKFSAYLGIENLLRKVDDLTRTVLTNAIVNDLDKFMLKKNDIDDWYMSLVFK